MSLSQSNVKVLPDWSAISVKHTFTQQERSLSPKSCGTGGGGKLYKMKLL